MVPILHRVGCAALLASLIGVACAAQPLPTVSAFDLDRYLGRWYQIALLPNRFQDFCVGNTSATYQRLEGGQVDVLNQCTDAAGVVREARGVARVNDDFRDPARLEVRFAPAWLSFLPFVWGDYWVIAIQPDYSAVMVGSPDRRYLWILAREPALESAIYARFTARAAALGFDVSALAREPGTALTASAD